MGVYKDHDMCLDRMAKACPINLSSLIDGNVETVEYELGDTILFNDFCCHWAETNIKGIEMVLLLLHSPHPYRKRILLLYTYVSGNLL